MKNCMKKLFPFFLVCTVIFLLFSCSKGQDAPSERTDTRILTNLYRETACTLPDGWQMSANFLPAYDTENGTFTVYAEYSEEAENADGTFSYNRTGGFFTLTADGTVTAQEIFELPKNTQITHGTFTDDAIYCVTSEKIAEQEWKRYLHRYDRITQETISSEELSFLLDTGMNFPYALCTDADGDVYLASQEKIVILRPNLTQITSVILQNNLRSMAPDRNGTVLISTPHAGSWCSAEISKTGGTLENIIPLSQTAPTLLGTPADDPAYVFYYLTDTFLWGMTYDEEGNPVSEAVIDLLNSGIGNTNSVTGASGVIEPCTVFDRDTLLFVSSGTPLLFRHAEDIDLDTIRTITLAYTESPSSYVSSQIVQFNKDHTDIQVVTKDYSSYTTEDKPNGAEEQLTLEITTGLFRPDIVLGSTSSLVLEQIVKNDLYTDLTPYLETDDTVNFDTLYGCIPRTFADGKGGMWAIASEFDISTIIASSDVLGKYADQTSWTLDEMLDFFESLPADVEKYPELCRDAGVYFMDEYALLTQGYGYFIDMESGTCSFESALFLRYLDFLTTLPVSAREWNQQSEYANLDKPEQFYARMSGKVAVMMNTFNYPTSYWKIKSAFSGADSTLIGCATKTDSGAKVTSDHVFTITNFTQSPDACWELLKYFFTEKQPALLAESGILSLKTLMDAVFARSAKSDHVLYTTGSQVSLERDPDNPLTEETLEKPGIILTFTDEDRQKYEDFLDRSGNPLIHKIPDAVTHIVKDEMSVYFGGLGTAEECAKKIQSRVSIWLSENQ